MTRILLPYPDYELIDSWDNRRLERFGNITLSRPEPQAIWAPSLPSSRWAYAHAVFDKSEGGIGKWDIRKNVPPTWEMRWEKLVFKCKLAPYRHIGIFPEQAAHWSEMMQMIRSAKRPIKVLNLFAYTGGASLACSLAGAHVTHVDASRPAIGWAQDNQRLSKLDEKGIRWILEDVRKFVEREAKRGNVYDGIIMDPPVFGHGADGEVWEFHRAFPELVASIAPIISPNPLFLLINVYAVSIFPATLANILSGLMSKYSGSVEVGELAIQESSPAKRLLSTGIYGWWGSKGSYLSVGNS